MSKRKKLADTDTRIVEFHDECKDEQGNRRFCIAWVTADGKLRAQEYHANPDRFPVGPWPNHPDAAKYTKRGQR